MGTAGRLQNKMGQLDDFGKRLGECFQLAADLFKEEAMEKYGVKTDDEKTKTASKKPVCPECGAEVDLTSNVPKCPKDGTRPFEKKGK
jgi:ribosomal protein S27AE